VLSVAWLAALGLGVVPELHAPTTIIDAMRSAPRRFGVRTVTRNLLLAALKARAMIHVSVEQSGEWG
jgi:hypothetical protein